MPTPAFCRDLLSVVDNLQRAPLRLRGRKIERSLVAKGVGLARARVYSTPSRRR